MAKALQVALSVTSKFISSNSSKFLALQKCSSHTVQQCVSKLSGSPGTLSRAHSTLSAAAGMTRSTRHSKGCRCIGCSKMQVAGFATEVEKEISKFLEKEISFENSRAPKTLPKIPGFDVKTEGGDVTLTKSSGSEKVIVKLSVNGAVDSIASDADPEKQDEPPQMVCKPPFEVEITKGTGPVLSLQCSFPSQDQFFDDSAQMAQRDQPTEQIDDQFEIQEVAIHDGEWKDVTFSVSAATMDAELFDLLMDMLDERGINDEFIAHLVDFCTAYENSQYVNFLQNLKSFVAK